MRPQRTIFTPEGADPIKRQVFFVTCMIFFFTAVTHISFTWINAPGLTPSRMVGIGAAAIFLLLPHIENRIKRLPISGGILLATIFFVVLFSSFRNGGISAPTTPYLIVAPLAAGLFIGRKAAVIIAIAATLVFAFLMRATATGAALASPHSESELIFLLFSAMVLATFSAAAIAMSHARLTAETFEQLRSEIKERKRSEALALHNANKYDLLFETIPVCLWVKDDQNRIVKANNAAAASVGASIADVEGAHTSQIFPNMDEQYLQDDLEVIISGVPKFGAIEKYSVDDKTTWCRTDKMPFTEPDSGRRFLIVSSIDVTDMMNAEKALANSEMRFATAVKGASVGIWDWMDVNRDEEFWTPRQYELLGYEDQEIEASLKTFTALLHPDDREKTMEAVRAHFIERVPFIVEYRLKHKFEGYRWFLGTGQAIWNEDGAPVRMIGSIMDIHERKLAEEKLGESELRFAMAAEASSVGIWDWIDVRDNYVYWTPRQYELLGYEDREITPDASTFADMFIHPEDREAAARVWKNHFEQRAPFHIEYRLKHKTDGYRWYLCTAQAIWDDAGVPVRMIGSIMDVHERKLAEEKVAEKAAALQRSNKELEQFARIASHDLKAPLRGIGNVASWLEEDLDAVLDHHSRKNLGLMKERIIRLEKLLDDLLSYARMDRNGTVKTVDVASMAKNVFLLVGEKNFTLELSPDLPVFETEQAPFELVIRNLLENAVKHHDRESGVVSLRSEDAGDFYRFIVSDDGPGIPVQYESRVFEMFEKLQSRDTVAGSGMGLAMVKKCIENHDGSITVSNQGEDGRGTAFAFTWPKRCADDETPEIPMKAAV